MVQVKFGRNSLEHPRNGKDSAFTNLSKTAYMVPNSGPPVSLISPLAATLHPSFLSGKHWPAVLFPSLVLSIFPNTSRKKIPSLYLLIILFLGRSRE